VDSTSIALGILAATLATKDVTTMSRYTPYRERDLGSSAIAVLFAILLQFGSNVSAQPSASTLPALDKVRAEIAASDSDTPT